MPAKFTVSAAATGLARKWLLSLLDGSTFRGEMTQIEIAAAVPLIGQGQVSRIANGKASPSIEAFIELAKFVRQESEAARVLGLPSLASGDEHLPAALREEIARDPTRVTGIAAAKSYRGASGTAAMTGEQWRAFIDHMEAQSRLVGVMVGRKSSEDSEGETMAETMAAKKRSRRGRLETEPRPGDP